MEIRPLHVNRASSAVRLLAPTSVLAGVVGLVPGQAIAAELPASCARPLDPYKASTAVRSACGVKGFPLQRSAIHVDGSRDYSYVVDGMTVTYTVPSANFDAATASPAELEQNGYPAEPPASEPPARADWHRLLGRLHFVPPPAEIYAVPMRSEVQSLNWAGYVDSTPGVNSYTDASGAFDVPSFNTASCSGQGNQAASFWSGLGGFSSGSGNLAQDGLGTGGGLGTDQAWWEILPRTAVAVNLNGTPGGQFDAETHYDGSNEFTFTLTDTKSGGTVHLDVTGAPGYDGSSADFIAEAPTNANTNSLFALTNFGTFSQLESRTNGTPVQNLANQEVQMVSTNPTHYALATPGSVSGQGAFQVNWNACS